MKVAFMESTLWNLKLTKNEKKNKFLKVWDKGKIGAQFTMPEFIMYRKMQITKICYVWMNHITFLKIPKLKQNGK